MTNHQRVKALAMIECWCNSYTKKLDYLSQVCSEFTLASEQQESVNYDLHLIDCIHRIHEMIRDMKILLRMQQVMKKSLVQKRQICHETLLVEFFHARKSYAEKWSNIDECVGDIMLFLQSSTET